MRSRQHEFASYTEHFEQIKKIQFNIKVTKKFGKVTVRCRFAKIHIVMSLDTPWTCAAFALGSPEETDLQPEGMSKHKVYQYLTNQLEKIYEVYSSLSEFPLGLLVVIVYMHNLKLFDQMCPCGKNLDLSGGPSYGLMPAMFRDMWMRPAFCDIQKHNLC